MSVVVCAYSLQRLGTLTAGVAAVREQLGPADELVLVIDHNEKLLAAVRERLPPGVVRVVESHHRPGLSGARNAGVEAAGGKIVVFLDDDALPRPDWLDRLTEPFADPQVVGTGGTALPAWEDTPPAWLPAEFFWVVGCSYRGLPETATRIRNPIGANMAFRRSVIGLAGGFSDGLGRVGRTPLGCEETEFSIRATRTSGGQIVQQPAATVDHLVTIDRLTVRYFLHRCWAEGISKAVVAKLTGGDAALASERSYTTRTLPVGILKGIRDGVSGEAAGFGRAAAIIVGFAVTVAGYVRGSAGALQAQPPFRSDR